MRRSLIVAIASALRRASDMRCSDAELCSFPVLAAAAFLPGVAPCFAGVAPFRGVMSFEIVDTSFADFLAITVVSPPVTVICLMCFVDFALMMVSFVIGPLFVNAAFVDVSEREMGEDMTEITSFGGTGEVASKAASSSRMGDATPRDGAGWAVEETASDGLSSGLTVGPVTDLNEPVGKGMSILNTALDELADFDGVTAFDVVP